MPSRRAPSIHTRVMVMLPPGYLGRAHFHEVDQFQVFFGGAGATYQRHEVPWAMLHYADAYTTYGPFQAGGSTLRFFTLRARPTLGTHYMPESRDKLVRRGRRTLHLALEPEAPPPPGEGVRGPALPSAFRYEPAGAPPPEANSSARPATPIVGETAVTATGG